MGSLVLLGGLLTIRILMLLLYAFSVISICAVLTQYRIMQKVIQMTEPLANGYSSPHHKDTDATSIRI